MIIHRRSCCWMIKSKRVNGKDPLDPRQGEVPVQRYTDALEAGVGGLRIGVLSEGFGLGVSEPDVDELVRGALGVFEDLGAETRDVRIPAHNEAEGIVWGLIAEGATGRTGINLRGDTGNTWAGVCVRR